MWVHLAAPLSVAYASMRFRGIPSPSHIAFPEDVHSNTLASL